MSASTEYETSARQDYGPATSSENVYEHNSDHKLADNMNVQSIRTPVLRVVPSSPARGNPEPDSTNHDTIIQSVNKVDKEVDYHISEKPSNTDMSVDSLTNIVRIEDSNCTVDNVGRIAYPVLQDTEDSNDGNYVENSATLIQGPLSTAFVQNVTKLPQNFTINMDSAAVSNITTIQNVSQDVSGAQTLWLPTILATSAPAADGKVEEDRPQSGVSQIIITSESFSNDTTQVCRRSNIVTETSYITRPKTSKVQILSNISLPKTPAFSQAYISQSKDNMGTPVYATQNHVYKLSTNVVSQKHLNSSVLCTKPPKSQALIGCSTLTQGVINTSPIKNVAYSHTFSKNPNLNKTLNKVNNGANLNAMVAASSGTTQCHILSRVVSAPNKMSVHAGRKNVTAPKGTKSSPASSQKNQSRPIKIIQQTGSTTKSEGKTWPVASVTYKSQQSYGVLDGGSKIIQKVGSPGGKTGVALTKFPGKGERLVLAGTAPVLLPRAPHYVQAGAAPLRYVQAYPDPAAQVAANQQLTAQILQSLAQPKLMLHPAPPPAPAPPAPAPEPDKHINQRRIVMGDKSTLLTAVTADDLIGMEERPNLTEELRRYSFQPLAFIMMDHTYALPAQKQPAPAAPAPASPSRRPATPPQAAPPPAPPAPPPPAPPATLTLVSPPPAVHTPAAPPSPLKRSSPVIISTASYEVPAPAPVSVPPASVPVSAAAVSVISPLDGSRAAPTPHIPTPAPAPVPDDDAGSVISSLDGSRAAAGGSDTETAPEGEEEGKTRCVCDYTHDDGYMICCDRCGEWQHVDCMAVDRANIPDQYMCELCLPRPVDRRRARAIQMRKREELSALGDDSDSSEPGRAVGGRKRLLTVTTYTDTSGSCVTTYNSALPALPVPPQPAPPPPAKRGPPKRQVKKELVRKGAKRKLSEKRVKRKKEMMLSRGKYGSSVSQSLWQDAYEQAVTNHYSPELRAKIAKYNGRAGGAGLAPASGAHLCTTVPHAGGKILIATRDLRENTPVVELRGKYMLSAQHRPQPPGAARAHAQKPGPFVFFYRLPKDNTQICIDTRTYGNEARFVRRSCKPNAELQHCIVKGTLHVYLVTTGSVQSNTEITVGHDAESKQACACGNPKHCRLNGLAAAPRRSVECPPLREKRGRTRCFSTSSPVSPPPAPALTTPLRDSPFVPSMKLDKSPIKHELPPLSPAKPVITNIFEEPMKAEIFDETKPEIDLTAKEEMKAEHDFDEPDFGAVEKKLEKVQEPVPVKTEPEIKEEIKEEPPAPIVKEVLEEKTSPVKAIPTKVIAPVVPPKLEERRRSRYNSETKFAPETKYTAADIRALLNKEENFSDEEKEKPELQEKEENKIKEIEEPKLEDEKPLSVLCKEVTAKSACHDRSSRSSRTTCVNQDSLDDKTDDSQDKIQTKSAKEKRKMTREERKMEAIMKAFERMEKAEQRKQEVKERQKRRESDPHPNSIDRDDDDEIQCPTKRRKRRKGRARTTSQSNRRRLNSADSDMVTSGDEAPPPLSPPRALPSRRDSAVIAAMEAERPCDSGTEELGLSSACLLVEAAVGSVESAFKLPKTKKTMATEWIGRSPERTPSPYRSPYRPALSAPSLESLVRVASTIIGDLSGQPDMDDTETPASPPRTPSRDRNRPPKKSRRITRSTPPAEVPEATHQTLPQHSAKKRWLRQAISEESDPPCIESPPNEMITPLKKRRLARESLSMEHNTVPCIEETSPVLTSEDSPVKDDLHSNRQYTVRNIMDSIYGRDRTRSDSGQGSDDQCNLMDNDVLNVNIKGPHDSENIRRIIGVPTPEDETPPDIPKAIDFRTNNNNVDLEESNYNKVVPMEIDTTIPQPKIQETRDVDSRVEPGRLESPNEKLNSCQSADTSGNSSPQRDEMDDIQKKIHSFHTENIMILKSRNKKPKEKRKINLNFDLNMVDDQISIQLRTEKDKSSEVNGDAHDEMSEEMKCQVSPENIPLPPESIPIPAPENIPLPEETSPMMVPPPETIPLPEEPMKPAKPARAASPVPEEKEKEMEKPYTSERPSVLESSPLPFTARFSSTGLFSGIFNNISQPFTETLDENAPTMSIIKSAIDRTTSLESGLFDKEGQSDEMRSVQEILTRVNNMDSNNSVLLSGVLRSSSKEVLSPSKPAGARPAVRADPRLNPPPQDKPKPIRRKLSITEYRKRKGAANEEGAELSTERSGSGTPDRTESSESSSAALSPQRLDAAAQAAAMELEQRLHKELVTDQLPKGVFDAQPTASERQREDLSSRLRREFGLALPDPHCDESAAAGSGVRCDR